MRYQKYFGILHWKIMLLTENYISIQDIIYTSVNSNHSKALKWKKIKNSLYLSRWFHFCIKPTFAKIKNCNHYQKKYQDNCTIASNMHFTAVHEANLNMFVYWQRIGIITWPWLCIGAFTSTHGTLANTNFHKTESKQYYTQPNQ